MPSSDENAEEEDCQRQLECNHCKNVETFRDYEELDKH